MKRWVFRTGIVPDDEQNRQAADGIELEIFCCIVSSLVLRQELLRPEVRVAKRRLNRPHPRPLLATVPRLQPASLLRAEVEQPIAIDARRGRAPAVRDRAGDEGRGEILELLLAPIRQGSRSQGSEGRDGVVVEVALRQGRIRLALPTEETLDIAAIPEQ